MAFLIYDGKGDTEIRIKQTLNSHFINAVIMNRPE
jgi:hypothetical protein